MTTTSPQSVSRRYAYNLLHNGSNKTFELEKVEQQIARTAGGLPCGFYFTAAVKRSVGFAAYPGEGITPLDAVVSALTAAGVTFR